MTLVGSNQTGVGSVDTAANAGGSVGPGGGITEITSTDGSITITDPTGPIVDLSAPGSVSKFSGAVFALGEGGDHTYLNDGGIPETPLNNLTAFLYPSGPRKAVKLRVTILQDSMDADYLLSLYKSGVPDGGLTISIPAASVPQQLSATAEVDFAEGDAFDVGARPAAGGPTEGGQLTISVTIEWA